MHRTAESKTQQELLTRWFFCRGKKMASDHKTPADRESTFSFGVRELKRAAAAQDLSLVDTSRLRAASESRGVDPYNTSGSFDRKRNWTRVGKR
jgi:hypothetical protein